MSLIENGVNPDALAVRVSPETNNSTLRALLGFWRYLSADSTLQTVIKDLRKETGSKRVGNAPAME